MKRTGKDTMANLLTNHYGFNKVAFADPIKDICKILFGWDKDFLESDDKDRECDLGVVPRDMMKWIGTDIFQYQIYERFPELKIKQKCMWVNAVKNQITNNKTIVSTEFIKKNDMYVNDVKNIKFNGTVVSDVRFIHEAEFIKENGGILVYIDKNPITDNLDYDLNELINNYIDYTIENKDKLHIFYENIDNFYSKVIQLPYF